ncbi:MAG TPA: glutamate dehydrogenase, partial [Myxococcales bacterium]|nr:glutamate dehydrogenase [Myxococcales bacterium]
AWVKDLVFKRNKPASAKGGYLHHYVEQFPGSKLHGDQAMPWFVKCDLALPCAAENTLHGEDAKTLLANGCKGVIEGANMPC